jgi:hypothetical protein
MSNAGTYAKPRRAGRGFAQSTWRLVAFPLYRIGLAGANAFHPFLPVALGGVSIAPLQPQSPANPPLRARFPVLRYGLR